MCEDIKREYISVDNIENGVKTFIAKTWKGFCQIINEEFKLKEEKDKITLNTNDYVWRGHRCESENWKLISSFDREFRTDNDDFVYNPDRDTILNRHLNSFVYAVRSRLKEFGLTVREIKTAMRNKELNKNHIWALAQHYDLNSPLLDWCYSPYVAAYFAFQKRDGNKIKKSKKKDKKHRIVWGLNYKQVCDNYTETQVFNTGIEYFDPMSSEHPRLINQRGLFTIIKFDQKVEKTSVDNIDIEGIIKNNRCASTL